MSSTQKTTTSLMFVGNQCGRAEEAMRFYTSLFKNSAITKIEHYKPGEPMGKPGTVKYATFTVDGQQYMAMDSSGPHAFTFTPAISIFVTCANETEIDYLYSKFLDGGTALMELGDYGFSKKFGWVADRFGVSWQLILPN